MENQITEVVSVELALKLDRVLLNQFHLFHLIRQANPI